MHPSERLWQVGDTVRFRHTKGNVKRRYPFEGAAGTLPVQLKARPAQATVFWRGSACLCRAARVPFVWRRRWRQVLLLSRWLRSELGSHRCCRRCARCSQIQTIVHGSSSSVRATAAATNCLGSQDDATKCHGVYVRAGWGLQTVIAQLPTSSCASSLTSGRLPTLIGLSSSMSCAIPESLRAPTFIPFTTLPSTIPCGCTGGDTLAQLRNRREDKGRKAAEAA
eukprot:SAG11_NODE_2550_length_3230_cov_2.417758_1_plen_224_part_00